MGTENTILLKGDRMRYEEAPANAALSPGHCLEVDSDGDVAIESAGDITAPRLAVALEDALQGKTQADAYATGDKVRYIYPQPGDVVKLRASGAATFTKGDKVKSATGGQIATFTPNGTNGVVYGEVETTVTTTAADDFVKVRCY